VDGSLFFPPMTERRYTEQEVAEIFERAAEARPVGSHQVAPAEGLSLADLQQIGREVGIAPEAVAQAARSLERAERPARRTFLGFPIGVGRSIDLGRRLTDEEWDRLVVDLRETFDARGRVRVDGSFRQWTNGNLQALLEPTPTGQRLRLRTVKENSQMFMAGGLGMLGLGAAALIGHLLTGHGDVGGLGTLFVIGLGLFGVGAIQLPGWARVRASQMEGVVSRLASMVASKPPELPTRDE
jgi:hypothetical protein